MILEPDCATSRYASLRSATRSDGYLEYKIIVPDYPLLYLLQKN